MTLFPEKTTRKLDNLGRLSIPKSMRDRLEYKPGDELEFFIIEHDGEKYVALKPYKGE